MKTPIVLLVTITLLGCAGSVRPAFDVPAAVGTKAGERAAAQQREAADCAASRHHPYYRIADAAAGDALAVAAAFVPEPGTGTAASSQFDNPSVDRTAAPSNCRPRRRHHYYA